MTIQEAREAINYLDQQQAVLKRFIRIKSAGREFYDVTPEDVLRAVSMVTHLEPWKIKSKDRHPEVVSARNITMHILRKYLKQTTKESAAMVGRDHATCIHATKTMDDIIYTYDKYGIDTYNTVRHLKETKERLGIT